MPSKDPPENRWKKVLKVCAKTILTLILALGLVFHGDFRFLSGFDGSYTKKVEGYKLSYPKDSLMDQRVTRLLISRRNWVLVYGRSEDEGGYTITGPTVIVMSNGAVHIAHGVYIERASKLVTPF